MLTIEEVIGLIPEGGIMSIIQRDIESSGDKYGLLLLKKLLESDKFVFVFLYEPFTIFLKNISNIGVNIDNYLNKNLEIFDVFGTMNKIERKRPGIHILPGYMDDMIFIGKLREWAKAILDKRELEREVWIMTYMSSGTCKLFANPLLTYKMIWFLREEGIKKVEPKTKTRTIITYSYPECPILEDTIYFSSDIVIETMVLDNKKVGIMTKGPMEGTIFELFKEGV
ncbi:hypothetical protein [Pyrococcus abyssi]|uniref:KaiC-like domain-containing protein n=1 Tax=Pyrococcus abyssi (strain GE5 / Orsay) TaxID=272844 RepID=Q9UY70_PYRAB|nr:hypothetical protein [Pyrococcus abyssi]CAB50542.1 Hypothetical protein PAB1075 [Pyrococcus abyssi GE5]CCE71099.1 TPA: hypothetical protein PAB1075 [Pyrococcus abyssi GE5]